MMKSKGRAVAIALSAALAAGLPAGTALAGTTRLSGATRYDTMSAIVSEGFSRSDAAVVACGGSCADALSASALAGALGCPVVLTSGSSLSPQAAYQLERLGVRSAYIMGGAHVVGAAVESAIGAMGIGCTRVAGADRCDTSLRALEAVRGLGSLSGTVVVANGFAWADALSAGAWCYATRTPLLLTGDDGLLKESAVAAVRGDAGIGRVVLVGGPVSEGVKAQLGGGYSYVRLAGANRYDTSALVAGFATENGLGWSSPAVATGGSFPDALAGAALCGAKRSVLLLADSAGDATMTALGANRGSVQGAYVLGGTSAVGSDIEATLNSILGGGGTQNIDSSAVWSDTADYDGDGVNETFYLMGKQVGSAPSEIWSDVTLWYVNSAGEKSKVASFDRLVYVNSTFKDPGNSNNRFLTLELTAGGSGSSSRLFTVRNGRPIQVSVAGRFVQERNAQIIMGKSEFTDEGHMLRWYELKFDANRYVMLEGRTLGLTSLTDLPF